MIANAPRGIAAVHLGDGDGGCCVRRVFFQRPAGVVHRGTGALGFQIHVRTLMLDGLEHSDGLAELFSSLGILDRHIERSEEHTSELQSLTNLVCRLLLEKKKKKKVHSEIVAVRGRVWDDIGCVADKE